MTHQENYYLSSSTGEDLNRNGLEAEPELVLVILNSGMHAEKAKYLQPEDYERTQEWTGQATRYKPKTVKSRIGEISFAVTQIRAGG